MGASGEEHSALLRGLDPHPGSTRRRPLRLNWTRQTECGRELAGVTQFRGHLYKTAALFFLVLFVPCLL